MGDTIRYEIKVNGCFPVHIDRDISAVEDLRKDLARQGLNCEVGVLLELPAGR